MAVVAATVHAAGGVVMSMDNVRILLEFEFPADSTWAGRGRLVEFNGRRILERQSRPSDYWHEHPSENAAEVAFLVFDAMSGGRP